MAEIEVPEPLKEAVGEYAAKPFTRRVALTTAVYAVILAIASLGGSHAMKDTLLAQQLASDQWAFYQAKVIREHLYRTQAWRLGIDLVERGPVMRPEARTKIEELQKKFEEEAKRYSEEKKDIEKEAKQLEHERDIGKARDLNYKFAEVLLQMAIVLASVTILSGSRALFGTSLVFAVGGTALSLNGYLLFAQLPV